MNLRLLRPEIERRRNKIVAKQYAYVGSDALWGSHGANLLIPQIAADASKSNEAGLVDIDIWEDDVVQPSEPATRS